MAVQDTVLFDLIAQEEHRQEHEINLIASENYASTDVMKATGSVLTNKYAEGYPGKRYYGGCQIVDAVEQHAIDRAKQLFNAEHANVQPHAGSPANMAVFMALLKPGDTILGMSLAEGGHLTHGHTVNFSGMLYNSVQYRVNQKTHLLDFDEIRSLALQHKPKLIIAGASAYSRTIDFAQFGAIAKEVGAYLMADIAHIAGLIAAGLHPNPFPYADVVTSTTHKTLRGPRGGLILCKKELGPVIDKTIMPGVQGGPFLNVIAAKAVAFHEALQPSFKQYAHQVILNAHAMAETFTNLGYSLVTGGTDNHLFILDVRSKNTHGKAAELLLESVGITVSRSCIPFDTEKPWITSGIRIGTPAITTRGMNQEDARTIAHLIDRALSNAHDPSELAAIKQQTTTLCSRFPIYKRS